MGGAYAQLHLAGFRVFRICHDMPSSERVSIEAIGVDEIYGSPVTVSTNKQPEVCSLELGTLRKLKSALLAKYTRARVPRIR